MRNSFINPFTAIIAGVAIGFMFVGMAGIHTAAARLERAAAEQCAAQDWPADKHTAMVAWCHEFQSTRATYGRY